MKVGRGRGYNRAASKRIRETLLNLYFLSILALAALCVWTIGVFFFWRISRAQKAGPGSGDAQPALKLAQKWMGEAQQRMEDLVARSEQPLSAAQNELLELRLEAGRLPQGVKNLKLVRESLDRSLKPLAKDFGLQELARLYLDPDQYRAGDDGLLFLRTPLGEMPVLRVGLAGNALGEAEMKGALVPLSRAMEKVQATGGFLYFPDPTHYAACLANASWMEGLKGHRLMAMDLKGLSALLLSLRLSRDSEKVVTTFQGGVDSTKGLLGRSDEMAGDLSRLSANTLKVRTILEGSVPSALNGPKEGT